ncbi:MAG TPA: hypothetical protein VJ783_31125 [Pirellulales bacterium]|nr:hypothetical protein [Pirellulales bacterium]
MRYRSLLVYLTTGETLDPMIGQLARFRPYYLLGLDPVIWGRTASLIAGVLVSLATAPPPAAVLSRLFESPSAGTKEA